MNKKRIGLVGPIASGKDVVASYLVNQGYEYYSLSDTLRQILKDKGEQITREAQINLGNLYRSTYHPGIWAELTTKNIDKSGKIVINSIRNPAEITYLKANFDTVIIAIDADVDLRVERVITRNRSDDPLSETKIRKLIQKDLGLGQQKTGQQVGETLKLADHLIHNNGTINDLLKKIKVLLKTL